MRTGGAAGGADKSDDSTCLHFAAFFGIDLTKVTIKTAEAAVVEDDIVAVAGVAVVHGSHPAREHAIDQTVSASQIYAVMEPLALGKGVLAVAVV